MNKSSHRVKSGISGFKPKLKGVTCRQQEGANAKEDQVFKKLQERGSTSYRAELGRVLFWHSYNTSKTPEVGKKKGVHWAGKNITKIMAQLIRACFEDYAGKTVRASGWWLQCFEGRHNLRGGEFRDDRAFSSKIYLRRRMRRTRHKRMIELLNIKIGGRWRGDSKYRFNTWPYLLRSGYLNGGVVQWINAGYLSIGKRIGKWIERMKMISV